MCLYNVRIDDNVLQSARPYFKGEDAMQTWAEQQLNRIFLQFVREHAALKTKGKYDDVLEKLETLKDDPEGFLKMSDILPPSSLSIDELREEAYFDKYGI